MAKQLAPYPLIRPGFKGLNTEKAADTTIGGQYALTLKNAIFDKAGRVASRKGWVSQVPGGTGDGDEDFAYVILLAHFNGTNGATTWTDSSSYAESHIEMSYNGALSTTHAEYGSASFTGDSGGGAARVIYNNAIDPLPARYDMTGDFTIEGSFYKASVDAAAHSTVFSLNGSGVTYLVLRVNGVTGYAYAAVNEQDGTTNIVTLAGSTNLCDGVWHKLCLQRTGNRYDLFVDGISVANATDASVPGITYTQLDIGMSRVADGNTDTMHDGWIDEVRYTNGLARYVGTTYDVATAPFPDNARTVPTNLAVMHEWVQRNGSTDVVMAGDDKLWLGTTVPVNKTGTLTPTADDWQFVNFRGYVLGFQEGHEAILYTGSGNFAEIVETSGTAPAGDCAVAAFGRVWAVDSDKQTIKYCALLDPRDWGSSDAGLIDMRTVWTKGMDEVVGLAAFGARLVVFGKRHIIMWQDGTGSVEGIDPTQMQVSDTIEGTGLAARDTIQNIGSGDVVYLSPTGLQSLSRALVNKNNPLAPIDASVSRYLLAYTHSENRHKIRSVYNARDEFYLLILPKAGVCFCFSTREALEDGSLRAAEWDDISPLCGVARLNGNVLFGFPNNTGKYSGYLDNGATYDLTYLSPWMTLADMDPSLEFRTKIPKLIGGNLYTSETTNITYSWAFDFDSDNAQTLDATLTNSGRFSEYNRAEYGENGVYDVNDVAAVAGVDYAEYGGSLTVALSQEDLAGDGRWVQVGLTATINDAEFAIQQLDLYAKVGVGIR